MVSLELLTHPHRLTVALDSSSPYLGLFSSTMTFAHSYSRMHRLSTLTLVVLVFFSWLGAAGQPINELILIQQPDVRFKTF